jgi:hypothetical protein
VPFKEFIECNFKAEDRCTFTILARYSKIHYLNDSLATYRLNDNSVSRPSNFETGKIYFESYYNQGKYLAEKFPELLEFNEKTE